MRSTPNSTFLTSGVWYDQHVLALPPAQKGDDGLHHVTTAYRFLNLPLPVAKELEDAAAQSTVPKFFCVPLVACPPVSIAVDVRMQGAD